MSYSLLAGILGLDATDFLMHLLNFILLVVIVSLLVYKPVIRFVHARRDEILAQEKLHDEKMKEAEETKEKYASLIGSAEQEIAARRKEADTEAAKNAEATLDDARKRAEKNSFRRRRRGEAGKGQGGCRNQGRSGGSRRDHRLRHPRQGNYGVRKRKNHRRLPEGMGRKQ